MVEQIMFIGIGFLIAGLLVIGVIPLVHARAVRLTMRRMEELTPLSMAEIQADKDQLRAEFAMTMSRLEMNVEQMKAKTTNQLADLSRKSEAIGRLKLELGEKTAALFALEAKEKQLSDDLQTTQAELAAKTGALEEAERALASARTELVQVTANFNDASVASGSQRVETVALRAQTEALKGQIDSYEKETKALWDHLNTKTAELEAANQQLAEERSRADNLANRVGEFDRQLTAQTAAARLDEQGQLLADREGHSQNLRDEATSTQKIEAEIRAQLAEMEDRHRLARKRRRIRAHGKRRVARAHRRGGRGGRSADRHARRAGLHDRNNSRCGATSSAGREWTVAIHRPSGRRIQRHARGPHPYLAGACITRRPGSARPEAERSAARSTRRQVSRTAGASSVPVPARSAR